MRIKYHTEQVEYINATVEYRYTTYYPEDPDGFKVSELIEVLQRIYADKGDAYIRATRMWVDDMFANNICEVCVCEWKDKQTVSFDSGRTVYN